MREYLAICQETGEMRVARARTFHEAALICERAWRSAPRSEEFVIVDTQSESDIIIKVVPWGLSQRDDEDFVVAAARVTKRDRGVMYKRVEMRYEYEDGQLISERKVTREEKERENKNKREGGQDDWRSAPILVSDKKKRR